MGLLSHGSTALKKLKNGLISYAEYKAKKFALAFYKRFQLHDYQRVAYDFIMANPFCALFIDMGLGKTITSLTVAVDLLMNFEVKKVLIIAPRRVAKKTWPDEIANWAHTCMFEYEVIDGTPEQRTRAMRSPASIHIISRDQVEWLTEQWKSKWPYDMVIIDESSSFKDHKTRRFKALRRVRPYMKRMVQLTATPAAETYMHLFAQIYLLDEGERFGKSITVYQDEYFTYNKWSYKYKLRPGAEERILKKIADICLVMRAEDYLDIQKPVYINRKVKLDRKQSAKYTEMSENFIVEVYGDDEQPVMVEAETAASLSSKLLQMASGVLYNTYLDGVSPKTGKPIKHRDVYELHTAKLDMLEEIVEECAGHNLLIGYHFQSSLDRIKKRFPKAVQMDKEGECVTKWNQGKIPMLLAHPQSAGHGLNLQKGGHIIVFYDIPYSLELYLQFIGRVARQGQTQLVKVIHLVAEGEKKNKKTLEWEPMATVDMGVVEAVQAKQDGQEWLLQELLRIRRRLAAKKRREEAAAAEEW